MYQPTIMRLLPPDDADERWDMDAAQHLPAPPVGAEPVTALVGGLGSTGTSGWQDGHVGGAGSVGSGQVEPVGRRGSVATSGAGGAAVATDPWPNWARPQLRAAVSITARIVAEGTRRNLAAELRRRWYAPEVVSAVDLSPAPLGGVYRRAHAGSAAPITADGISVVDRHDVIGRDGWWRTWGDAWSPTRSRGESVRVLLSPRPDALAEFVTVLTGALRDAPLPWLLACPTSPRRLHFAASAVLYVPDTAIITAELTHRLRPTLRPVAPPLCLPIAPGIAMSEHPANGMGFGEHRCHLLALALRGLGTGRDPLNAIADTFVAHGIDPATPHRSPRD